MDSLNKKSLESNRQIKINFDGGYLSRCRTSFNEKIHLQTWFY